MLGELPPNFLRVTQSVPNDTDQQYALALDRQLNYSPVGRLNITVDQVSNSDKNITIILRFIRSY